VAKTTDIRMCVARANARTKRSASLLVALVLIAPTASADGAVAPERLLVVDCLLPSQVRHLVGSTTFLAPRHAIKTVAKDCEERGGEYVAYDRANFATSLKVWKPQAEQGDPQAQVYVGEIYEKGLGTAPDLPQAAFWYQKAADQGFARGLADLAYLYEQGLGVPKDPLKALNLYRKSAGISNDELTFAYETRGARDAAASQVAALTRQLADSNEQIIVLRQALDAAAPQERAKSDALRAIEREVDALRGRVKEMQQASTGRHGNGAELERLQQELLASEARLADQQRDSRAADAASRAKTAELAQRLQAAAAEDAQLREQLGGRAADAQQAQADLAAARARVDSMNAQILQLRQELSAEQAHAADQQSRVAQRSSAHDAALGSDLSRVRQALADRDARVAEQQTLLAHMQGESESAAKEVERLKTLQAAAEQQQRQQRLDSEALRAQLVSSQQRLLQSEQKLGEATALAAEEQRRVAELRTELQQRRDAAPAEQPEQLRALAAELAQREPRVAEQQARIASLQAQIGSYNEEIAKLQGGRTGTDGGLAPPHAPPAGAAPAGGAPQSLPQMSSRQLNLTGYYALIIGNDTYQDLPSLASAVNDARAIEGVLQEHYGFKTRLLINATRTDILTALNDYRQSLGERDSLLIYYAGHGEIDGHDLVGYWLPVNAKRGDKTEWMSDRMITDEIGLLPARHVMVIADSYYSGAMMRSSSAHLVATSSPSAQAARLAKLAMLRSRTVLTSGMEAPLPDGASTNSIFARVLLDVLWHNHGVLEESALFDRLFDPVRRGAARLNVEASPRYSALGDAGHLNGEFLLFPLS